MKTQYQVIGTDGIIRTNEIDWPKEPSFTQMAELINPLLGDSPSNEVYFEHVRVWHEGQYVSMYVDDSGPLKRLPVNKAATEIYHANLKFDLGYLADTSKWPCIHGTAILFNRNVWA